MTRIYSIRTNNVQLHKVIVVLEGDYAIFNILMSMVLTFKNSLFDTMVKKTKKRTFYLELIKRGLNYWERFLFA